MDALRGIATNSMKHAQVPGLYNVFHVFGHAKLDSKQQHQQKHPLHRHQKQQRQARINR